MILTLNSDQEEYWAIETKGNVVSGPMSKDEFARFLKEKKLHGIRLAVPSDYTASNADLIAECRDRAVDAE